VLTLPPTKKFAGDMPSITTRPEKKSFHGMDLMLREEASLQLFGHKQQHLYAGQPTRISCDRDRNVPKEPHNAAWGRVRITIPFVGNHLRLVSLSGHKVTSVDGLK
jgi:hypothetical protein